MKITNSISILIFNKEWYDKTKRTNTLSLCRNNVLSPTNTVTFSFFAQEISASEVNVTTSINNTIDRKFDQLNNKLNKIDTRVSENKTLAENNTSRLEQLEEESKITNSNSN